MLGGISQQNIFMKRNSYQNLESQGVSTKNAAKVAFYVSVGVSVENSQASGTQEMFMNEVHESHGTKLGGDPSITDLYQWVKTVPSNPVIVKFGIRSLFDLLTSQRFPNDVKIHNKSKLIERVLQKYIQQPVYCFNNCTDALHGKCVMSGYFQYGECNCTSGWTGIDCAIPVVTTKPPIVYDDVLSGTLCGYDRSFVRESCNGRRPWNGCPSGWIMQTWTGADLTVCYKASTSKGNSSIPGVLCGLNNSGGKQSAVIRCNSTTSTGCPAFGQSGYVSVSASNSAGGQTYYTKFCVKSSLAFPDLPGTLCGIQWASTTEGPACGSYNPGLSQCPYGYELHFWTLETGKRFFLCAKR
ncbi:unnamed protein product [Adineta steineri]|uniref:EGF-like domain-containing protein n=1 Tax=Adineta steineri TaxID=433720 RepID=A0A813SH42_9BILA|nr:unnamed protein product [Adineta steineri]CAF4114203.1 unnamed protein product [Adineta steineri]